jgi:hypothetical protein
MSVKTFNATVHSEMFAKFSLRVIVPHKEIESSSLSPRQTERIRVAIMAPLPTQHVVNGNGFSMTDDGELDFSDLERQYAVSYEEGFDNFIIVDNCPIVTDEVRKQKLIAFLRRIFGTSGTIKEDGIYMPMGKNPETGDVESRGYVFIEYDTPEQAVAAIKTKDGHPLDKSHRLSVNKFTDIEKYATQSDQYVEPEIEPYVQKVRPRSEREPYRFRSIYEVG